MASEHPRHAFVERVTEQQGELPLQTFPVNMYEAGDALVIVAALPAGALDEVSISVDRDRVVIEAALRTAAPKDYLLHECRYGGYRREVQIPAGFGASAEASLANGQLAVRILRGDAQAPLEIKPTAP